VIHPDYELTRLQYLDTEPQPEADAVNIAPGAGTPVDIIEPVPQQILKNQQQKRRPEKGGAVLVF
jgi:4-hydroxy-3-methylbut-2-enyl diphosphate reductase IspH